VSTMMDIDIAMFVIVIAVGAQDLDLRVKTP
jgi:hypothetical protein